MSGKIEAIKGINDVRPGARDEFLDSTVWQFVGAVAAELLESNGYRHVWLPLLESTSLFSRGIGEGTDIVSKEMYTFEDRGGRSLTLRPEGTAGAARAYVEHGLFRSEPLQRWWYMGPMFRAEAPQQGRYRQFYQIGAEFFGVERPEADAELLLLVSQLVERLGIPDTTLRINTLGSSECRARYRVALATYLEKHFDALSEDSQKRVKTNPLRFLDSKDRKDRELKAGAPDIIDSIDERARAHFDRVCALLDETGVRYERDPHLVRGLDYYSDTTFELTTSKLGAQDAVLGGGRYDGLVEALGGPATPAIGFAAGLERLAMLVSKIHGVPNSGPDLLLIPMAGFEGKAFALADQVRSSGPITVEVDVSGRKVKATLKRADKIGARTALVLGEEEVRSGRGNLKDLSVSSQLEVELNGDSLAMTLANLDESE